MAAFHRRSRILGFALKNIRGNFAEDDRPETFLRPRNKYDQNGRALVFALKMFSFLLLSCSFTASIVGLFKFDDVLMLITSYSYFF